jgi:hypothetical protein
MRRVERCDPWVADGAPCPRGGPMETEEASMETESVSMEEMRRRFPPPDVNPFFDL